MVDPKNKRKRSSRTASQCIGTQYVASVDPNASGCLVDVPRVGRPMLFARVDANGRVSLIRTGALMSFEVVERDRLPDSSDEISTSAPVLRPSNEGPSDYDLDARTLPVRAVESHESIVDDRAGGQHDRDSHAEDEPHEELDAHNLVDDEDEDEASLRITAEYAAERRSAPRAVRREFSRAPGGSTIPWGVPCSSQTPTLSLPPESAEDEENPYAARRYRGPVGPRYHDGASAAQELDAHMASGPPARQSDVQVSSKRRR